MCTSNNGPGPRSSAQKNQHPWGNSLDAWRLAASSASTFRLPQPLLWRNAPWERSEKFIVARRARPWPHRVGDLPLRVGTPTGKEARLDWAGRPRRPRTNHRRRAIYTRSAAAVEDDLLRSGTPGAPSPVQPTQAGERDRSPQQLNFSDRSQTRAAEPPWVQDAFGRLSPEE